MAIVKVWRNRIWAGTQRLSDCPSKYRSGVIAMMRDDISDGIHTESELRHLVDIGMMTAAEYEEITGESYEA